MATKSKGGKSNSSKSSGTNVTLKSYTYPTVSDYQSSGVGFDNAGNYQSQYNPQINKFVGSITNRQAFNYDPLQDANYQALAKVYNANGEKAMRNTLGQAAALNGGFNTSWATSAAAQARNDYNQQLAALIPELEANAYDRYVGDYNMDISGLGALLDLDNSKFQQFDSDRNYGLSLSEALLGKWATEKGMALDAIGTRNQAAQGANSDRLSRAGLSLDQKQFNWNKYMDKQTLKQSSGGSRGGRSGGSRGGGSYSYSGGGSTSSGNNPLTYEGTPKNTSGSGSTFGYQGTPQMWYEVNGKKYTSYSDAKKAAGGKESKIKRKSSK